MERLHRDEFWRVEQETWGADESDEGYYLGTETFLRGTSTPYLHEPDAILAAVRALRQGDWVKVVHYPSHFEGTDRPNGSASNRIPTPIQDQIDAARPNRPDGDHLTAMSHENDGGLCWCGPSCGPVAVDATDRPICDHGSHYVNDDGAQVCLVCGHVTNRPDGSVER